MGLDPCSLSSVPATTCAHSFVPPATLFDYFAPPAANTPASDSAAWGDSIHTDPGDLHRVYFQNIDGMRNNADEMDLYVSSMAQFHTSTFSGQIMVLIWRKYPSSRQ